MSDFTQKFIEEAHEFISQIESALLSLEEDAKNAKLIDEIFRYMHSLKGSGGMFGFDNISTFTHDLETLFDEVRKGKQLLNEEIIEITYQSVDLLKQMLKQENDKQCKEQAKKIKEQITQILENKVKDTVTKPQEVVIEETPSTYTEIIPSYHIFFEPNENILDVGTNPLYLLDELHQLGHAVVIPHFDKLPSVEKLDPHKCYVSWDIFLSTKDTIEMINDVFLFVEDDCNLEINLLCNEEIVSKPSFQKLIDKNIFQESPIDHALIKQQIENLKNQKEDIQETQIEEQEEVIAQEAIIPNAQEEIKQVAKKEKLVSSIRVDSSKIDNLLNMVSELITTQSRLQLNADLSQNPELIAIAEDVEKISRQLRENAFEMSLIPIHNLTTRFKRLVRDLGKELNKEVVFESEGTDTELDKSIIEQLADPIMHILRNAIDHGIESKETRLEQGKSEQGCIHLKAFYSGTYVHISIEDNGKGIDTEKLKEKGISKGLLNEDKSYTQQELYELLFMPGFSTNTIVSDISGRGVGMDVVKQRIEELRGDVSVESTIGKGSKIILKIPLTLSIIDGLLVMVGNTKYIIPLSSIDKIYETKQENIQKAYNNTLVFEGEQIQFLNLNKEFEDGSGNANSKYIIVVTYEDKRVGLTIDQILGEYQTVLKPLGRYLKSFDIFSGASVLGDGKVALVMDTNKVVNRFSN